ncbi:YecA family protein [Desulfosediminicola flagellatus]|uniref:YecA family protein n=1 Tax=Desulfosediminicola flagellatus TaxID=2569541 RepID=UPI001593359A|nr:SEC-C domain-containing protein [Desulfosediminicola flagellatus]
MTSLGRNQPCHCGSGKKYKKCCLHQDEETRLDTQEQQEYEQALANGEFDPLASDEDWEEGPDPDWVLDDYDDDLDDDFDEDSEFDDWYPDDDDDTDSFSSPLDSLEKSNLPDEAIGLIEAWWDLLEDFSTAQEISDHISRFLDEHPALVADLGLEDGPMQRLELLCCEIGNYQLYVDIISRLRDEFPEGYTAGFPIYDHFMIHRLIAEGKKDQVVEYLDNFKKYPEEGPEELLEVVDCLMANNCLEILSAFLPELLEKITESPFLMDGREILHPIIALTMAPFLDKGLDAFVVEGLIEALTSQTDLISSDVLAADMLQKQVELIFGRKESWRLEECTNRIQAIELYDDITRSFMGWIHREKSLDWCAAEFFRLNLRDYLYSALPERKKPRMLFPFGSPEILMMFTRRFEQYDFDNNTDFFASLNSVYWFTEFLEDHGYLDQEQAVLSREACRKIFDTMFPELVKRDFAVEIWQKFPWEILRQ